MLQGIGIPYSALMSIIFGMMILSFPLGAFVVFNSDVGDEITYEYPLEYVDMFFALFSQYLVIQIELGDAFIVIWAIFVVLFAIGMFGPKDNVIKTLTAILSRGKDDSNSNYLASVLKWFAILVFLSVIIEYVQKGFGISIEPPEFDNDLIQFFSVSLAPLTEEIGFRVLLIGVPLYAWFYRRTGWRGFLRSLWHPYRNLDVMYKRRVFVLIVVVGVLFGLAHVFVGESWSNGKFVQASLGGIILGWVYYRHGLVGAILLHWATNYFILSYVYFVAYINDISANEAFSHSLLGTLELLFFVSGAVSLAFMVTGYFVSKRSSRSDKIDKNLI